MEDKGDYKTSVGYMAEIARGDIEGDRSPDSLRTYQHTPAPGSLGSSQVVETQPTYGASSARSRESTGSTSTGSRRSTGTKGGSSSGASGVGDGIGAGVVLDTNGRSRLDKTSDVLDCLSRASKYGESIAKVFRYGITKDLALMDSGQAGRNILRRVRICAWQLGKGMAKAGEGVETAQQLCVLARNALAARGKIQCILDSGDPWDVKTARMGCVFTAVSAKTIAHIAWEPLHQGIGFARTAAAFFGADVSHPAFDPRCSWRTWVSWQPYLYFDNSFGYLTEHVYAGDIIYAFIHTHVRRAAAADFVGGAHDISAGVNYRDAGAERSRQQDFCQTPTGLKTRLAGARSNKTVRPPTPLLGNSR